MALHFNFRLVASKLSAKSCLIVALSLLLVTHISYAGFVTFEKEYTYQASELDSKVSCRVIAMEQVKRLLLEELGTYLESETEVKDFQITKDQINIYTAGIVKTNIIDEKWDGKMYWLKVQIKADPSEVAKSVKKLQEKREILKELTLAKQRTDKALEELDNLKKKMKNTKQNREKIKIQNEYKNEVNKVTDEEMYINGLIALGKGNYDEAIDYAKQSIALVKKDDIEICGDYSLLGTAYYEKGMFLDAITAFNRLLELQVCSTSNYLPLSHYILGQVYRDMKKEESAIAEFKKALELLYAEKKRLTEQPLSQSAYYHLPDRENMIDESITDNHLALFTTYLSIAARSLGPNPSSKDTIEIPEEALAEFKKVLLLKPNSPRHFLIVYTLVGRAEKYQYDMIAWCNKLIASYPNTEELYSIRGKYFLFNNDFQKAIKDFSKAIELNPQNSENYFFRGVAFGAIKNYKQDIEDLNRAIELSPKSAEIYFSRGLAYYEIGNYELALKDYNRAIEIDTVNAKFYRTRGDVYLKLGNQQLAINDLRTAARLGDKKAQDFLMLYKIGW